MVSASCYLPRPRVERNAMIVVCPIRPAFVPRHLARSGAATISALMGVDVLSPGHPARSRK